MVEIRVGQNIPVANARTGSGQRGDWYKIEVKADKGYDRIGIWATNPEEAKGIMTAAEITKIVSVKLSEHQYNGKWLTDYTVNAELKQAGQGAVNAVQETMFADPDKVNDDDLPFN